MRVLATSLDPRKAAKWVEDVSRGHIIEETSRILQEAVSLLEPTHPAACLYQTRKPVDATVYWASRSRSNFKWLTNYLEELGQSYDNSLSMSLLPMFKVFSLKTDKFLEEDLTLFPASVGVFHNKRCSIQAHRAYLINQWEHSPYKVTWKRGEQPHWYSKSTQGVYHDRST